MDIVTMAWRAGLGDVGKGMQFLLSGTADEEEDDVRRDKTTIELKTPKGVRGQQFDSPKTGQSLPRLT
jgi:hypothetical protein